ncbi:ABC transporter permease [Mesorhizobium sp. M1142]
MSLLSLFLLSIIIFVVVQVLPGDVGRRILGPLADQRSVDKLNELLGVNRPLLVRYLEWAGDFVRGNFGTSYVYRAPVAPFVGRALGNSALLALFAIVIALPSSVVLSLVAARNEKKWLGGMIGNASVIATAIPEFVVGVVLLIVFGVMLGVFPTSAQVSDGSSLLERLRALVLPAVTVSTVLTGYLTRMIRARASEIFLSDHVRYARTLGFSERSIVLRNVLRNSIVPTIPVIATQVGYLVGSLTVVELLFNYDGIGLLILKASQKLDLPMLMAGVLVSGIVFMASILIGDALVYFLDPRRRFK